MRDELASIQCDFVMHTYISSAFQAGVRATVAGALVVGLTAVPLSAQQPAAAAKGDKPAAPAPKPQTATSPDGTKIVFEVTGSGPALILLPGGGQTRHSWAERGYVEPLSKEFTVISMDLRGTGDSDKPTAPDAYALDKVLADVTAVADAAKAQKFLIWGFGHGATIGRYLAAQSDRVIAAVLVGATMGPPVVGVVKDALTGMRAKWMPLIEAQQKGAPDLSGLSDGDRAAWKNGIGTNALMLGALLDYPPLEPTDIKAPTLWLVGANDEDTRKNAESYQAKLKGTQVTFEQLDSLAYSDSFSKTEPVMAKVMPFLAAHKQ